MPVTVIVVTAATSMRGFVVHQVERGERVRWNGVRHAVLARETISRIVFGVLAPVGWFPAPMPTEGAGIPVLLVPDPTIGRASLSLLHVYLRQRGLLVWPYRFVRADDSLAERAGQLSEAIDRLARHAGTKQVDIVAFGLGGLVAAYQIVRLDDTQRVRRLVTLGTPWRGTRMAVFIPGALAQDVHVGSHALDGLDQVRIPTLAVWCPEDPEVVPAESARVDEERSVAVDGAGHRGLLASARAFRAVRAGLTEPTAPPPEEPAT